MSINPPGPNPKGPSQKYPYSSQPITNDPKSVDQGHSNSDVDSSKFAQHHTLGYTPGQASPGNHVHDGSQSKQISAGDLLELSVSAVSYTPTWVASTTNPTVGNGSIVGRYFALGKLIFASIRINFGSTTNSGVGNYMFGLPVTSATISTNWLANGVILNGGKTFSMVGYTDSGTRINAMYDSTGNRLGGTGLFGAWASGDFILLSTQYEAA